MKNICSIQQWHFHPNAYHFWYTGTGTGTGTQAYTHCVLLWSKSLKLFTNRIHSRNEFWFFNIINVTITQQHLSNGNSDFSISFRYSYSMSASFFSRRFYAMRKAFPNWFVFVHSICQKLFQKRSDQRLDIYYVERWNKEQWKNDGGLWRVKTVKENHHWTHWKNLFQIFWIFFGFFAHFFIAKNIPIQ